MRKIVFLAFLVMSVAIGEAATITVGGTTGWTIPSNAEFYDTWEDAQNFTVGDTLEFNFAQGSHTVARVSETDYDSCNLTSPIFTQLNSPFSFVINDTSDYYFLCTIGNHCTRGMKLAITDVTPSSSSPSPPPPPPSTTSGPSSSATPSPPPPPQNAAQSVASSVSLAIVAVTVAFGFVRV